MMTIIESLKNFLENCPLLGEGEININYLSPDIGSYTIDKLPKRSVVKRYCDGETLCQFCILLGGRQVYDGNTEGNLEVSEFFEKFEDWINTQNRTNNLPDVDGMGLTPIALEVINSGYISDTSRTSARFQIELRFLYRQKNSVSKTERN